MDLRNPPGRAEKSINFLCCDHSVSDVKMDCYGRVSKGGDANLEAHSPGSNQGEPQTRPTERAHTR